MTILLTVRGTWFHVILQDFEEIIGQTSGRPRYQFNMVVNQREIDYINSCIENEREVQLELNGSLFERGKIIGFGVIVNNHDTFRIRVLVHGIGRMQRRVFPRDMAPERFADLDGMIERAYPNPNSYTSIYNIAQPQTLADEERFGELINRVRYGDEDVDEIIKVVEIRLGGSPDLKEAVIEQLRWAKSQHDIDEEAERRRIQAAERRLREEQERRERERLRREEEERNRVYCSNPDCDHLIHDENLAEEVRKHRGGDHPVVAYCCDCFRENMKKYLAWDEEIADEQGVPRIKKADLRVSQIKEKLKKMFDGLRVDVVSGTDDFNRLCDAIRRKFKDDKGIDFDFEFNERNRVVKIIPIIERLTITLNEGD